MDECFFFLCFYRVSKSVTGFFESERGFSENPAFRLLYGIFRRKNPVLACFWYVFRWKNPVCVVFALSRRSFLLVCALFHTPFLTQPISPLTIPLRKRKRRGDRKEGRGKREILPLKAPRDSSIVTTFSVYWNPFQYSDPAIQYTDPKAPIRARNQGFGWKVKKGKPVYWPSKPHATPERRAKGGREEKGKPVYWPIPNPSFSVPVRKGAIRAGKKNKKMKKSKSGRKMSASI